MRNKSYHSNTAFIDLLFNVSLSIIILLCVVIFFLNPISKKYDVETVAPILFILEWDPEKDDDLDIHIKSPSGQIVNFMSRQTTDMNLDLDDRGISSERQSKNEQEFITKINREVVSIRNPIDGEYVITIHAYRLREGRDETPFKYELIQVTPYKIIHKGDGVIKNDEEKHIINIIIENKRVINTDNEIKRNITHR